MSFFDLLEPGLTRIIGSFLCTDEALNLAKTSRTIHINLGLRTFDGFIHHGLTNQHWRGLSFEGDQDERIWFSFMSLLKGVTQHLIHTIRFECDFYDWGLSTGNGRLYVREEKNKSNFQGDIVVSSPFAGYQESHLVLQFYPKPGKRYTMCFVVGGENMELFVKNPRIRLLLYDNA